MEPSEFSICLSVKDCSRYDSSLTLSWLEVGNKKYITHRKDIKVRINCMWFLE